MNVLNDFRLINQIEKKIIAYSLTHISLKLRPFYDRIKSFLYISIVRSPSQGIYPSIYLISKVLQDILNPIQNNIYLVGLYFGFIKKGIFYLSLEGVEFLYKQGIFTDFKKISVNNKGEKSTLYGNNILKSMVLKIPSNLHVNDFLVIINEIDEIIAIARSRIDKMDYQYLKSESIIAMNLCDKGIYLRKKQ